MKEVKDKQARQVIQWQNEKSYGRGGLKLASNRQSRAQIIIFDTLIRDTLIRDTLILKAWTCAHQREK
jgi:hypothetical protein